MSTLLSGFPEPLVTALNMRTTSFPVPMDVERALRAIPQITKAAAPPARFGNLSHISGGAGTPRGTWRGGAVPSVDADGFETVAGGPVRRRHHGGGGVHRGGSSSGSLSSLARSDEARSGSPSGFTVPSTVADGPARFSSAAVKATGDVVDRMMVRIKGKVNRIGPSTYDATKVFLQQILSGDETEFLDELMKFIFQKAATESTFCCLYAKLLHELADEFGHIRTVMHNIFRAYLDIFTEVSPPKPADENTSEYRAFVEAQERKKFRRGYSQFVAELVKLEEAPITDFSTMLLGIVTVLESLQTNPDSTLLSEEYIDCLNNMCLSAGPILASSSWAVEIQSRLSVLAKKPKTEVPGFSNKARFAIMELVDIAVRGWKRK
jgi:hypothetical protein